MWGGQNNQVWQRQKKLDWRRQTLNPKTQNSPRLAVPQVRQGVAREEVQVGNSWQQRLAHVGRGPDPQPAELLLVGAPILMEPLLADLGGLELSPQAVHGVSDARALCAWEQRENG